MSKTKTQSGRSMVEMLGVLAIIGVLSIGGIAGYTMAMNRYKANAIIDKASKLAITVSPSLSAGINTQTAQSFGDSMVDELNMLSYSTSSSGNVIAITFYDADYSIMLLDDETVSISGRGNDFSAAMSTGVRSALEAIIGKAGDEDRWGGYNLVLIEDD